MTPTLEGSVPHPLVDDPSWRPAAALGYRLGQSASVERHPVVKPAGNDVHLGQSGAKDALLSCGSAQKLLNQTKRTTILEFRFSVLLSRSGTNVLSRLTCDTTSENY